MVLFKAYDLLPAQEAQPLNYTWAVTLVLFSIPILKQKIGIKYICSVLVSYSGVVVISTHGNILSLRFSNRIGNLIFMSPFLSLVFIHSPAGEKILASILIGVGLIVSGLLIKHIRGRATLEADRRT